MFNFGIHLFPTINDIICGLIKAHIQHLEKIQFKSQKELDSVMKDYVELWGKIFSFIQIYPKDKPLTVAILSNPDHEVTKLIIYIYTMESFIFKEMNQAMRDKDVTKIDLYGPLAAALSFIV